MVFQCTFLHLHHQSTQRSEETVGQWRQKHWSRSLLRMVKGVVQADTGVQTLSTNSVVHELPSVNKAFNCVHFLDTPKTQVSTFKLSHKDGLNKINPKRVQNKQKMSMLGRESVRALTEGCGRNQMPSSLQIQRSNCDNFVLRPFGWVSSHLCTK